jgi:lytic murein transglycosylase
MAQRLAQGLAYRTARTGRHGGRLGSRAALLQAALVLAACCSVTVEAAAQAVAPVAQKAAVAPVAVPDATAPATETFPAFLARMRTEAAARGIDATTLARAFQGLTADLTLPDLVLAGRPSAALGGQAEFSKTPLQYLNVPYLLQLASDGRALAGQHAATLAQIEREIGVDRNILLAIWGRETAFGKAKLGYDVIRVLATQAWTGRRRAMFTGELLAALQLMQDRVLDPAVHKASWAGALGLVQFMPTEFANLAVDLDRDGKKDLWRSVPDALGSAAQQLKSKGWTLGQPWGVEVTLPAQLSCIDEGIAHAKPAKAWLAAGVVLQAGARIPAAHMNDAAFLLSPGGAYGPTFLVFENFMVLKRYNFADLYAVFVGHLADRIGGGADFVARWRTPAMITNADIADVQARLKAKGRTIEKVDGRAGMNTRTEIGQYQRQNGLTVDCWASAPLLRHLKGQP